MSIIYRIKKIQLFRSLAIRLRLVFQRLFPIVGSNNTIRRHGITIHTKLKVRGDNNIVEFQRDSVLMNVSIDIYGNNHYVLIDSGAYLQGTHIVLEDNECKLSIGKDTFIGPSHIALTEDYSQLTIGEKCMISSNVQIRTGDSHAIFNCSGSRINKAADVHIGNMVWLGEGSKVLKGVTLKDNIVVSTAAVVTKSFESNALIGGVPAKVIKESIYWSHSRNGE